MTEEKDLIMKLPTGEAVNKLCYNKLLSLEVNQEAIFDILDVYSHIISVKIGKVDWENRIIELEPVFPKINEEIILLAMKNVKDFHEMKRAGMCLDEEGFVDSRRERLMKDWKRML